MIRIATVLVFHNRSWVDLAGAILAVGFVPVRGGLDAPGTVFGPSEPSLLNIALQSINNKKLQWLKVISHADGDGRLSDISESILSK
jgi:hypothetical protein